MLKTLMTRLQQGRRTIGYPRTLPVLPDRFRGMPVLDPARCSAGCEGCARACPVQAVSMGAGALSVDLGSCLFCTACSDACSAGALHFSNDYRLAASSRSGLHAAAGSAYQLAGELQREMKQLFGRSLRLRQVSAGGCNGCEVDVNVLNTVVFDIARFGIQIVASPRHADGLLVTGPVSKNMEKALLKTYEAVPAPKLVIASGACAISGGPFAGHAEVHDGVERLLPVDLFIPGCPPHPLTILDGLLRLLGRIGSAGG